MKRMKKKMLILLVTAIAMLSMAMPASAAVSKASQGSLKPGLTYRTSGKYTRKFFKTATLYMKQKKGTAIYKQANGRQVKVSSYAKVRVIIRQGGENGKIVKNTIWKDGTFTFKCKANQKYTVEVSYIDIEKGKVLVGPRYFHKWQSYPTWNWIIWSLT